MMMIPLIMRTTEEVLLLVPDGYREAALALGIAQWRTIAQIVVRTALKGIVTGVLLAVARVAGETAPLIFTALGNRFWNHTLSDPIAALPLQIFSYAISPYVMQPNVRLNASTLSLCSIRAALTYALDSSLLGVNL